MTKYVYFSKSHYHGRVNSVAAKGLCPHVDYDYQCYITTTMSITTITGYRYDDSAPRHHGKCVHELLVKGPKISLCTAMDALKSHYWGQSTDVHAHHVGYLLQSHTSASGGSIYDNAVAFDYWCGYYFSDAAVYSCSTYLGWGMHYDMWFSRNDPEATVVQARYGISSKSHYCGRYLYYLSDNPWAADTMSNATLFSKSHFCGQGNKLKIWLYARPVGAAPLPLAALFTTDRSGKPSYSELGESNTLFYLSALGRNGSISLPAWLVLRPALLYKVSWERAIRCSVSVHFLCGVVGRVLVLAMCRLASPFR